jgi:hypothetical protein
VFKQIALAALVAGSAIGPALADEGRPQIYQFLVDMAHRPIVNASQFNTCNVQGQPGVCQEGWSWFEHSITASLPEWRVFEQTDGHEPTRAACYILHNQYGDSSTCWNLDTGIWTQNSITGRTLSGSMTIPDHYGWPF